MIQLCHPWPAVDWARGGSFGGSQSRSAKWLIRKCGCGAVAMTDLVIYLARHHSCSGSPSVLSLARQDPMGAADYDACCCSLQKKYLPAVPPFGINGLVLTAGINAYFQIYKLPFRARWNASKGRLWPAMEQALARDLPVILSIGPNLPAVWQNQELNLYRKSGTTYTAAAKAKAHYVTVTAMDDTWLQISSWGKEYYIHRQEYVEYGERHSTFLVHNVLVVEPRST